MVNGDPAPTRITMDCMECGYALSGLGSCACPECGCEFDPHDPATFRQVFDATCIARLPVIEATALRNRLEHEGIAAALQDERGGVIGYAEMAVRSVWVDRADEEAARALLAEPPEPMDRAPWTCATCGERIEGQFGLCWNCGAERPAKHE